MIWTIIDGQLIAKNTVSSQSFATHDHTFHKSGGINAEENVRYMLKNLWMVAARFCSSNVLSNHLPSIQTSVVGEENGTCLETVKDNYEHKNEDPHTSKPQILTV